MTRDFINPEMAWPAVASLRHVTESCGFELHERLATYPEYLRDPGWMPENLRSHALQWTDAAGVVRRDQEAA